MFFLTSTGFHLATLLIVLFLQVMNTALIADARDICSSLKHFFKLPRGGTDMTLEKLWQVGDFSVHVLFAVNNSHCGSIESMNL